MTPQEKQRRISGWMHERMEQGYGELAAHSYALLQLAMLEENQTEARRLARRQALEQLIAEHQAAIILQDPLTITHETIIMALQQVQRGWVYAGQAARILAETAERVRDEPEKVALYRAAIAELARIAESEGDA